MIFSRFLLLCLLASRMMWANAIQTSGADPVADFTPPVFNLDGNFSATLQSGTGFPDLNFFGAQFTAFFNGERLVLYTGGPTSFSVNPTGKSTPVGEFKPFTASPYQNVVGVSAPAAVPEPRSVFLLLIGGGLIFSAAAVKSKKRAEQES